jgi:hypothetical protein
MLIQNAAAQEAASTIAPIPALGMVIAAFIAAVLIVLGIVVLIVIVARRTERPLDSANFFVVIIGILAALSGYLVAFPLLVTEVFTDPTQVLALLSGLFGTVVGLVGTFFGIKTSSDARQDAKKLASDAIGSDTTPPTVSSVSPLPNATGVSTDTSVTATFSKDMDPATINTSTFKLVEDASRTPVAGSIVYDSNTNGATFQPSKKLSNKTMYRVRITADVKDKAGNALAQEDTWVFTTDGLARPASGGSQEGTGRRRRWLRRRGR